MHCTHRAYKLSHSLRAPRSSHPSLGLNNNGPVRSVTQTQRGRWDDRRGEPDERQLHEGGIFARVAALFSCGEASLEAREGGIARTVVGGMRGGHRSQPGALLRALFELQHGRPLEMGWGQER